MTDNVNICIDARLAITSPQYIEIYQVYQNTVKNFLDRIQEHNPRKHRKTGVDLLPLPSDSINKTIAPVLFIESVEEKLKHRYSHHP